MRVDTRPRKRNAPRPAGKHCPAFLQWLRGRECLAANANCEGKIQAAHVDYAGGKGMGTKVADRFAVPLCALHHFVQHQAGWGAFQATFKIDGLKAAAEYWRAWPGRPAWERKLSDG